MKNKEIIIRVAYWTFWLIIVGICTFFIIFNAHWWIGDDAIVISHTGMGKAFVPNDPLTFNKTQGRFFPFSYLAYDILLLFNHEYISPTAHYALQAVFFVFFAVCIMLLSLEMLEGVGFVWKYVLSFLVMVASIGRVYPLYLECFATSWCGYTIIAVFLLLVFMFYKEHKWKYGVLALFCINYLCYCGENVFILPLSMGTCALLFNWNSLTKGEKLFNWLLVGSALLFLLLYCVLVLPYVQSAYDSGHGLSVGIFENAGRMLWAQKFLILAFIVFVVRLVDVVKNKKEYTFYDNLLFTAAACCCGNFILRLNWTLYYNVPVLLSLIAVLYFSMHYLKEQWTTFLFALLALYLGIKIPQSFQKSQKHRIGSYTEVVSLSERVDSADGVYWYAPNVEQDCYELELRKWKHKSLCTYLGWLRKDPSFSIPLGKEFHFENNTIWLTPSENKVLFPEDNQLSEYGELVFRADNIEGYWVPSKE